jgi:hypothetical protein
MTRKLEDRARAAKTVKQLRDVTDGMGAEWAINGKSGAWSLLRSGQVVGGGDFNQLKIDTIRHAEMLDAIHEIEEGSD